MTAAIGFYIRIVLTTCQLIFDTHTSIVICVVSFTIYLGLYGLAKRG